MTDISDFQKEVIDRSHQIPVVADFWAEWCGPCKILGPILERLAGESGGAWALAKVNTEIFTEESARYGVRNIPVVKMFYEGNQIAEFVGAMPEYAVRQWLKKYLPGKSAKEIERASALVAAGKNDDAAQILGAVIAAEPSNAEAKIVLARAILYDKPESVPALVATIDEPRLADQLELIETFLHCFRIAAGKQTLPDGGAQTLYLEATQAVTAKEFGVALEKFIEVIRSDRMYDDDGSRKACVAIFKWLGEDHPVTLQYRRDFSSALY